MLHEDLNRTLTRFHNDYSLYGFSVYCDPGMSLRESYDSRFQLQGYRKLRTATVGAIKALGLRILPTNDKGHFTIVLPEPLSISNYSELHAAFSNPIDIRYQA